MTEPFKNQLSAEKARWIGTALKRAYPAFPAARFSKGLDAALEPHELKQRMLLIAGRIESCLPDDPQTMFPILTAALATHPEDRTGLRGFLVWPLTEVVARRGLGHFQPSRTALREMTRRLTSELAIRPFLRTHRNRTLKQLHAWCDDPDEHVRRLVSEGSRPLLPWGGNLMELLQEPHPTLELLERLYQDPSDYVRLSVSNHLNDFSKHHPRLVIGTLTRWREKAGSDPRLHRLSRHACRTLLKAGDPGALELHGFGSSKSLDLTEFFLNESRVKLGGSLGYRIVIRNSSKTPVKVMFDYAIHHLKANGTLSPKVFKGRVRELAPGETWRIDGRHPIRPITTRVYYPGTHAFEPLINGRGFPPKQFELAV